MNWRREGERRRETGKRREEERREGWRRVKRVEKKDEEGRRIARPETRECDGHTRRSVSCLDNSDVEEFGRCVVYRIVFWSTAASSRDSPLNHPPRVTASHLEHWPCEVLLRHHAEAPQDDVLIVVVAPAVVAARSRHHPWRGEHDIRAASRHRWVVFRGVSRSCAMMCGMTAATSRAKKAPTPPATTAATDGGECHAGR